jgi:hypothetical protein
MRAIARVRRCAVLTILATRSFALARNRAGCGARPPIISSSEPRSPQEKKELSYARDGRNAYRENDKASRKAIPRRKSQRARATRRLANQQMPKNVAEVPVEQTEDIDRVIGTAKHKHNWRKKPDIPLRDWIAKISLTHALGCVRGSQRVRLPDDPRHALLRPPACQPTLA